MSDALKPITLAGYPGAPPLLLLHGFMGCAADWQPIADALGTDFHVLAVNLPGHGPGWETEDIVSMDFPAIATALATQIDAMHLRPVSLLGYSMGGRLALYFAHHYPEHVSRLILESASPGLDTDERRASRCVQDDALAEHLEAMAPGSPEYHRFLESWFDLPLFATLKSHTGLTESLIQDRMARCIPALLAASLRACGTGRQPNLWPELHAFKTPTLLITGELDRKFRIIAEDMALVSPGMASEILTGCGHNVHLENPEAFITVVRAFLKPAG